MLDLWLPPKPAIIRPAPEELVHASFLPGMFPAGAAASSSFRPASFVFNGTDELLTRTLSTSGAATTKITISMWLKTTASSGLRFFITRADSNNISRLTGGSDESLALVGTTGGANDYFEITGTSQVIINDTWHHYVCVYDSTQGNADDRIKFWIDNTLKSDTSIVGASLNQSHRFFENGRSESINDQATSAPVKLAFIEILEGVSADPTSFGFDNGGTWTRKKYTGSYGTYGFLLNGTDGFNDVSGNGQNFTGTNMTVADNLNFSDLPPFTN